MLTVPVVVPLKSYQDPSSFERSVPKRYRDHGVRIPPAVLAAVFTKGPRDIVCPGCGFSHRALMASLKGKARRR